jgi:phospholipid-binding lipoprotein MlaA
MRRPEPSSTTAGWRRSLRLVGLTAVVLALSGCASLMTPGPSGHKRDPWENWNRKVFAFNESLDENVLKPVTTAYSELVPRPVRLGIDNFFGNVGDAWSAVNLFLQGRLKTGLNQTLRFAINSTMGFGGVIDIAGEAGIERNSEDMGRTFGRWGSGTGAYIVWPLFGPSSVRDTLAMPLDWLASPSMVFDDGRAKVGITALKTINTRANLLQAGRMLDDIALDKYTFLRDAYLARRSSFEEESEDDYEVITPKEGEPQAGP